MIFFFIAAWLAYKKAKASNRSGIVWALVMSAAFIGTQIIVGASISVLIFLGATPGGAADQAIARYEIVINIASVIASVIVALLILKYLGRAPKDDSFAPPPAPPTFD